MERDDVSSMVTSYGEQEGRVFFYMMSEIPDSFPATLTLSEAAVDPNQFEGAKCGPDGNLDPEDPRCAKLSLSGTVSKCDDSTSDFGMNALLQNHPQMADWPDDHGFAVFELDITSLWMIANFGGGGYMDVADYKSSSPEHHPVQGFPTRRRMLEGNEYKETKEKTGSGRPDFGEDAAGHARWLVAKSLWTTVSTVSAKYEGNAFGNIRSVVDGVCFLQSSGLPVFYLPDPDPTTIDIKASEEIALSFTEAALSELVVDGKPCGGDDAESPVCAKISLSGRATPLADNQIEAAKQAFGAQHPRARWLAGGGAHTGGSYYTIDLESIEFLRNFGGFTELSVKDYLKWEPNDSMFKEEDCNIVVSDAESVATNQHGGGDGSYQHGGSDSHESYQHGGNDSHGSYQHGGMSDQHGGMSDQNGGMSGCEGHEHGSNSNGEAEHGGTMSSSNSQQYSVASGISMMSFMFGMAVGVFVWGPTAIALFFYHRECGMRGRPQHNPYEPAIAQEATMHERKESLQVV